ncbi:MAG: T9SS type A sorting domain-containing protein [Saprospiraceae bacterium]|nr:T9SS type A sorting domain-containing protein [Saprospiraceae bacterium]
MTNRFAPFFAVISFLFFSLSINAQITVGTETLPDIGDVLEYAIFSYEDDTTSYRMDGEDLSWSYDISNIDSTEQELYLDIAGTPLQDSFPMANMVVSGIGFEAAALRTMNNISILGLSAGQLGFFGMGVIHFEDPWVIREVPIDYGDSFSDSVSFSLTVSSALFGLDTIMIMGATIDSMRFNFNIAIEAEATAWGSVNVNGQSFEVLKLTSVQTSQTGLELGINFGGTIIWVDGSLLFGDVFDNAETSTSYSFLSADSKESIIEFQEERVPIDTLGNTEIEVVGRMKSELATSVRDVPSIAGLKVSPNPAVDQVAVTADDPLEGATYRLLSLDGKVISEPGPLTKSIDVRGLRDGTYILEIRWSDRIGTARLVKH